MGERVNYLFLARISIVLFTVVSGRKRFNISIITMINIVQRHKRDLLFLQRFSIVYLTTMYT